MKNKVRIYNINNFINFSTIVCNISIYGKDSILFSIPKDSNIFGSDGGKYDMPCTF